MKCSICYDEFFSKGRTILEMNAWLSVHGTNCAAHPDNQKYIMSPVAKLLLRWGREIQQLGRLLDDKTIKDRELKVQAMHTKQAMHQMFCDLAEAVYKRTPYFRRAEGGQAGYWPRGGYG